jgi:AcrR family transcriptional regulator
MPTQTERRDAAIASIIEAAHSRFAAQGFEHASIDDIADAAGMTKGSVYHYFATKEALFQRVLERLNAELAPKILTRAVQEPTPAKQLKTGCRLFLEHCLDPAVRQILLIDGPRVLGWELWREIDARYFLSAIETGLADVLPRRRDANALAHLLIGALDEAVMVVSRSKDPAASVKTLIRELGYLIDALIPDAH